MAKSHHDVGIAFGKLQNAQGSRMTSMHTAQPLLIPSNLFNTQAVGVSYRTVVARIVTNTHTKRNELWVTPQRHSNSTARHKQYLLNGFRKAHANPMELDGDIFITPCTDDGSHRHNPTHVLNALRIINRDLPDVNLPRIREATRRGTLTSCLHRANVAMTNFTRGIPLDAIDAPTLYELQHTIDFITTTLAIPDIDEVRAAVRGYLALQEVAA